MALPVFHLCRYNMDSVDFRRVGQTTSGGTSLSGLDDPISSDGGGFWRLDASEGDTFGSEDGLDWRADIEAMDGGASPVIVLLCSERLFQPVNDIIATRRASNLPLADECPKDDPGARYVTTSLAQLRATAMSISGASEKPVRKGMLFSIEHPNWGWRAYRIVSIDDAGNITFRPPLREKVDPATPLEFDRPRCQMRITPGSVASNPTSIGRYTQCAISLVEDMRPPANA